MKGPSRWIPKICVSPFFSFFLALEIISIWLVICSLSSVITVGHIAPSPCFGRMEHSFSTSSEEQLLKSTPYPPWMCLSNNAGVFVLFMII